MLAALISNVIWPPGYYILRDRVPFFLTLIFFHRKRIPYLVRNYLGHYLALSTMIVVFVATALRIQNLDMSLFSGIHWSAPSPIEWGLLITSSYLMLYSRNIPSFESFYIAFITAMGGGWLYEFIPLLFHGFNWFVFFKINAVKVFFMEFQVFCLPIIVYLIWKTKTYEPSKLLIPVGILTGFFYAIKPIIEHYVRIYLFYSYNWVIRVPAIIFLFIMLSGIKGEKQK